MTDRDTLRRAAEVLREEARRLFNNYTVFTAGICKWDTQEVKADHGAYLSLARDLDLMADRKDRT